MNVLVQEAGPGQTHVTANTRYILTRTIQGQPIGGPVQSPVTATASMNSGQAAVFPATGSGALKCRPTGKLEADVLELVR